ncbi:MAG: hypothetical protein SH807_03530 [Blastochloris sp.]|nr:hypothetical protein [Blastochloris sp.]
MNFNLSHKQQHGGILKTILILLGALTLLVIVALVGAGWYAKVKIDEAGGMQAVGSKMMAKGVELLKPELEKVLPAEDLQRLNVDIIKLQEQAAAITPEQIQAVANSMQKLGEKMQGGGLSEADAKIFVDEVSAALKTADPIQP